MNTLWILLVLIQVTDGPILINIINLRYQIIVYLRHINIYKFNIDGGFIINSKRNINQ